MGRTLATLSPPRGARSQRKRLGRGHGSGLGTTAGRGQKGEGARSGTQFTPGFEGGQMPLQRRMPKRGFKNPFRVEYHAVNLAQLARHFEAGAVVTEEELRAQGLVPRKAKRFKILGDGALEHSLTVKAHAFSAKAREKIEQAGGTVELLAGEVPAAERVATDQAEAQGA